MTNKMWGGRFSRDTNELLEDLNASIKYDYRLAKYDIEVSIAHAMMLAKSDVIKKEECDVIVNGLKDIKKEINEGKFELKKQLEDIHMNIESRLTEIIGPVAGKLHTARSRNDQVATDTRLFLIEKINYLISLVEENQKILSQQALDNFDAVMPGYTHLQIAQPITLGHHLLSYVELLNRDKLRLMDTLERLNESPLGAAAMAGTSYPIDRKYSAKLLGFDKPMSNSIDAVSSRDMLLETLSNIAILSVNLSRLAEEIILWVSTEFNYITLPDSLTTGSSIMPQKRNPDGAEIIRSKAGRVIGSLNTLLVVMKGLPLTYNKDLQEDKEPLFDAIDTIELSLQVMCKMICDMKPNRDKMLKSAKNGFSIATDIADVLVQSLGIPFREAHKIVGSIVSTAEANNKSLDELLVEDYQKIDPRITIELVNKISFDNIIHNKTSLGGSAPKNVKKEAEKWLKALKMK
ncbi:MAG: argininosuccinate lyase [Alphaproteobacteria bacterium]|tara:strand:- start:645 stop:2030 length:1386 start_codon:yes stop_codon:yes gene_type:complete